MDHCSADGPVKVSTTGGGGPLASRTFLFSLLGWGLLAVAWQAASMFMHSLIVPAPLVTLQALGRMLLDAEFMTGHFLASLWRVSSGVLLASAAGFALGVVAGLCAAVRSLLEPLRWLLMSVPAVVVVVVAMLWFGMGDTMVIAMAALFLSPVVYVSTVEGMDALDDEIMEMTAVYRFPLGMKIRHVFLPAITAPLGSALVIVVCNGVRVAVLAEVLGANNGIGYRLAYARTNLDIPELYGCVLLCLALVGILEFLLLRPLQNHLLRWRSCSR